MSSALIREFYAGVGDGDIAKVLSLLTPDVVWRLHGPDTVPYFGAFHGPAGVAEFFRILDSVEQIDAFAPTDFIEGADGEHVFVRGNETCMARETGRSFSTEWLHVFRVTAGKIALFEEFIDSATVAAAYRSTA